jgi:uncharacterized protein YdeI (YjbR/CyaY-like superfamily)
VKASLGSAGGAFFLLVTKELRQASGAAPGNRVKVTLAPADAQESALPADLESALAREPAARTFFDALSPFYRNAYVVHVTGAKREETRSRRVEEVVTLLKAGKKQRAV